MAVNGKVILQLKHVSVVNSYWLYPSLMTQLYAKRIAQSYRKGKVLT